MRWLLIFLLGFPYSISFSQSGPYKTTDYTIVNGLPDNSINSLIQDSRGFMWIGTSEGLSRFDGNNFKNYFTKRNDPLSLPGNTIAYLNEYKPGHLLFQSAGRLITMNTLTREFQPHAQFTSRKVYGIRSKSGGGYFVYGLDTCFVLNKNLEITEILIPPLKTKARVVMAASLNDNTHLAGSQWEYFIYNIKTKSYVPFPLPEKVHALHSFFIFQYFDTTNKHLYFSNYWLGIYKCSLNGEILHHWRKGHKDGLLNSNISFIKRRTDNTLWVGTMGDGLYVLNILTNEFNKIITENNSINSVIISHFTDKKNNDWIGTKESLTKLTEVSRLMNTWQKQFSNSGKSYSLLNITKGRDDQIYLTLFSSNTVFRINRNNGIVSKIENKKLPFAWCMNAFGDEIIFTGGGTKITKYNPVTNQFTQTDFLKKYFPESDVVILAFKHSNGDEWYSGNMNGGFVRVTPAGKIHHYKKDGPNNKFSNGYYAFHAEDKKGNLWFGVNKTNRLLKWDKQTEQFNEIEPGTIKGMEWSINHGITDLTTDNENNLWIAFDGSGLVKYNIAKNEALQFTIENGLPTNYLYSVKFDGSNRLWIGTPKGLSCLLVNENRFATFTKGDGLPEDIFNERCMYYDSADTKMWVGSLSALISFNPDTLLGLRRKELPVFIDNILVNSMPFHFNDKTDFYFTPSQTNFQFHFTGLDINNGKNIEYSYKLSGADKDWMYNGHSTTAQYANLNPGKYAFTVRARHKGDNEWSIINQPFNFIINTPWFKTWWFRLIGTVLMATLIWYMIRSYYHRKMEKQRQLIEKELAIEHERTRVARELHDGLGSMLSGVKHSFSAMQNQLSLDQGQQLKFHNNIDKLNDSIKELRNITHSMATENTLKSGLENSVREYCQNFSQPNGISISFNAIGTQNLKLTEDQTFHSFRIIQELLHNIIRHSGATNAIVQISSNNRHLQIAVEDDGKGFNMHEAKQKAGIGLKNIETRVKILKGHFDFRTAPGKGTSVLIDMPFS